MKETVGQVVADAVKSEIEALSPEPKKVYIVTAGAYSDYAIVACFSTRELAEKYVKINEGRPFASDYNIEEYELDNTNSKVGGTDYFFEYAPASDILTHWIGRRNDGNWNDGYYLFIGEHKFALSGNGIAIRKFFDEDDVSVIKKIAQDKYAEIKYNDIFLEEV